MHESFIAGSSAVHRIDARVKAIFTLAFILMVNLVSTHAWLIYFLFLTVIGTLTLVSRVKLTIILKRSLIALPFILSAIPLLFVPSVSMAAWQVLPGVVINYNPAGLVKMTGILFRSWISILATVLLTATTRFTDLMAAFQALGIPRIIVAIISLMWRYLFLIVDEAQRLMRARAARSAQRPNMHGSAGRILLQVKTTGGMAGNLFLRSMERSDRVYAAMLSRGYTGEVIDIDSEPISILQKIILSCCILAMALVVILV